MFTIKAFHVAGHFVAECSDYVFVRGHEGPDGFLETIDRLEYKRLADEEPCVISLGKDAVFVMNSNGKTIDNFQGYPPDDKRRWAVDVECAHRQAAQGNPLALAYLDRMGTPADKTLPDALAEAQIKHMVDRFLGWKLPKDFRPDAGISYAPPNYTGMALDNHYLSGTNLFDATQADAMMRYLVEGMPA